MSLWKLFFSKHKFNMISAVSRGYSIFASGFGFVVAIYSIIVGLIHWNSGCEKDLAPVLFATGVLIFITCATERLILHGVCASFRLSYLILIILMFACIVEGGVLLGIYTFGIDQTNHICNNWLYWSCFVVSIVMLVSTLLLLPLLFVSRDTNQPVPVTEARSNNREVGRVV